MKILCSCPRGEANLCGVGFCLGTGCPLSPRPITSKIAAMPSLRETIRASLKKEEARRQSASPDEARQADPIAAISPIIMPKWGLAMIEGTVVAWQAEIGSDIAAGQDIMEIETSKIANVYESPVTGLLRRIVVQEGETVPVGALLGVCAPASITDAAIEVFVKTFLETFDGKGAIIGTEPMTETRDVAGKTTRFVRRGDGPGTAILFLHGFGSDCLSWFCNQEVLAERHTTYALDLPGHGGSSRAVGDGDLAALTQSVMDFMDRLEIEAAHLVGHSIGGAACLSLALGHPNRVASATLLAPAGLGPAINMEVIEGLIAQTRARGLRRTLERQVSDPAMITSAMVDAIVKHKRLDGTKAALSKLRDGLFPAGRQQLIDPARLAGLSVPVQAIWGEDDRILPVDQAAGLPESVRVIRHPDVGHLPHIEKAHAVNAAIAEWIAQAQ